MVNDVGSNIRRLRKEKGLTIGALAEKTGVTMTTVSRYELGEREPKMSMLKKIADALSVDVWEIIGFNSVVWDTPPERPTEAEYVKILEVERDAEQSEEQEQRRASLNAHFDRLNETGQQKAVDTVADLAEVPKYRKEGGEQHAA